MQRGEHAGVERSRRHLDRDLQRFRQRERVQVHVAGDGRVIVLGGQQLRPFSRTVIVVSREVGGHRAEHGGAVSDPVDERKDELWRGVLCIIDEHDVTRGLVLDALACLRLACAAPEYRSSCGLQRARNGAHDVRTSAPLPAGQHDGAGGAELVDEVRDHDASHLASLHVTHHIVPLKDEPPPWALSIRSAQTSSGNTIADE